MSAGIALNGRLSTDEEDYIRGLGGSDDLRGAGGDTIVGGRDMTCFAEGAGRTPSCSTLCLRQERRQHHRLHARHRCHRARRCRVRRCWGFACEGAFYAASGATPAHDVNDLVIYNTTSGKLFYDDDGKGGPHAAVFVATLSGRPVLDHADFVIV